MINEESCIFAGRVSEELTVNTEVCGTNECSSMKVTTDLNKKKKHHLCAFTLRKKWNHANLFISYNQNCFNFEICNDIYEWWTIPWYKNHLNNLVKYRVQLRFYHVGVFLTTFIYWYLYKNNIPEKKCIAVRVFQTIYEFSTRWNVWTNTISRLIYE